LKGKKEILKSGGKSIKKIIYIREGGMDGQETVSQRAINKIFARAE